MPSSPPAHSLAAHSVAGLHAPNPVPVLYVCYLEADEPLVATQVVAYLRGLARLEFEPHLLTFEKQADTSSRRSDIATRLRADGIRWHSLRYHKSPSLPATLFDITQGALLARRLCREWGIRLVHGRSHVGAAIAELATSRLRVPFVFDVRGLLADEYVDSGNWRPGGLKYRLTKGAERHFLRRADGLVFLTRTVTDDLRHEEALTLDANVEIIPCCVDTAAFRDAAENRARERSSRGWDDRTKVLLYVGKLGGWYLVDETVRLFATARLADDSWRLQVLTQSDPAPLFAALARANLPSSAYSVERAAPDEARRIMVAADVGLSLIRTCRSKRSSSPTKVGEYLAAGLPVVSTPAIGDCDSIFASGELGVILNRLDENGRTTVVKRLRALIGGATPERCRSYAERELSLMAVGVPRYAHLYRRVIRGLRGRAR